MSKCARNQKLEIFEPDRLKIPKFPVPQDYRDSVATFADFNNHQKIPDNDQNTFAFTDFKSCIDRPVINQHRFKIFTYQYCEKCELYQSNDYDESNNHDTNRQEVPVDAQLHNLSTSRLNGDGENKRLLQQEDNSSFTKTRWYTQLA